MPATATVLGKLPLQSTGTGLQPSDFRERHQWAVQLSAPDTNGSAIARAASGIPPDGDLLAGSSMYVVRAGADPDPGDDSGINYVAWVEYGFAPSIGGTTGGTGVVPWLRGDSLSFSTIGHERYVPFDYAGNPIVNTANDPLGGGLALTLFNPLVRVGRARTQGAFNPFTALASVMTLNSSAISIRGNVFGAKKALLHSFTSEDQQWTDGTAYYNIIFEIELEGQVVLEKIKVQNRGMRYLLSGKMWFPTYDSKDPTTGFSLGPVPTNAEIFLKTNGDRLPDNTLPTAANGYTDLEFVHYPTTTWSWL